MAFPLSHKTVIVLDHGPEMIQSSKENIDFDVFNKSRGPGIIPLAPVTKSLWTCNVESAIEYCRIVYDLFPTEKLVRFITSDIHAISLNSWQHREQNVQQLLDYLAEIGPPSYNIDPDECNILHGLTHAIEVLCEPSGKQHEIRTSLSNQTDQLINNGRIICMTTLTSPTHLKTIEDCVSDLITQHNILASSSDSLIPIDNCELVFIHVVPVGGKTDIRSFSLKHISASLTCELCVTESGYATAIKMVSLSQLHYDLFSTTVTGIPMKEEQNAGSSANYDVELLHAKEVHIETLNSGSTEGLLIQSKENLPSKSLSLKWCTPKSNIMELLNCVGAYRITPVDVNSRPSACLTNFLLSGRAVMLEQPRKVGTRLISHMLASHGGELLIHILSSSRSVLEDPPSISEGCGGRVTDYRITDFGEFMKENRLAPTSNEDSDSRPFPADRMAKSQLERMTRVWPIVIGETYIFNMLSHLDPLPTLIVKQTLDDDDVMECKKAIYHVVGMESRNEPLPVPMVSSRTKGNKREEQYKQMWNELENLIRAHVSNSPLHKKVLECLLDCRKPSGGGSKSQRDEKLMEVETDIAAKELEKFQKLTEREKQDMNKTDLRRSQSPPAKKIKTDHFTFKPSSAPQSLYSMWTNRMKAVHAMRHVEFAGREDSMDNKATLYPQLLEQKGEGSNNQVKNEVHKK